MDHAVEVRDLAVGVGEHGEVDRLLDLRDVLLPLGVALDVSNPMFLFEIDKIDKLMKVE